MKKDYGQYCGLSHALDLIGGRWTLLIVRELLTGPKRFTDLEQGLPGIPTNMLSTRLRELEDTGLIERKLLPRPLSGVVYALTDYGRELEDPLMRLGLWGARSLPEPSPDDFFSYSSLAMGLRAMFRPEAVTGVNLSFAIEGGTQVLHGTIEAGDLVILQDDAPDADLVISAEPAVVADILRGVRTVDDALAAGDLPFEGSNDDLRHFFAAFTLAERAIPQHQAS
ncbi:MAG: winged helix-turn-helix transcriptional regulator [Thermomicrobiales bacterium]